MLRVDQEPVDRQSLMSGAVDGCDSAPYKRHMNTRKPYPKRATTPWQERFWRYVTAGPKDECWEWTGSRNALGYGRLNRGRVGEGIVKAHRASWEIHNGPIPGGLHVCHKCDNPPCVNPAHLFLGTMATNLQDASKKGRTGPQRGGTAAACRRLTDEDVRAIREAVAAGESYKSVSRRFGIYETYASALARGIARLDAGGPLATYRPGYPRRRAA